MAKKRGRPFESGNNYGRGRPRGSRNREKSRGENLLDQYEQNLIGKCISMALEGNIGAMNICVNRLLPAGDRRVKFALSKTRTIPDISRAFEQLTQAVAKGKLAPGEAESVSRVLEALSRILEKTDTSLLITEPTMLTMPDGSTVSLTGPGDYLAPLFGSLFGKSLSSSQAAQVDLIRWSTGVTEPGGGHMVELLRALLHSPVEERT
jgi:hypothetical protein